MNRKIHFYGERGRRRKPLKLRDRTGQLFSARKFDAVEHAGSN